MPLQPSLFDSNKPAGGACRQHVVLWALGDFQSRGKRLAGRELPLDRLRGALKRGSDVLEVDELTDDLAVDTLSVLGAEVRRVPTFVAKHPYRVKVPESLACKASIFHREAEGRRKLDIQK